MSPVNELGYVTRPEATYLRLTSSVRRNGVKLFVQIPLSPSATEELKKETERLLFKRLDQLLHGRKG